MTDVYLCVFTYVSHTHTHTHLYVHTYTHTCIPESTTKLSMPFSYQCVYVYICSYTHNTHTYTHTCIPESTTKLSMPFSYQSVPIDTASLSSRSYKTIKCPSCMYIYAYVNVCVCVYIYIYICIHTHTHCEHSKPLHKVVKDHQMPLLHTRLKTWFKLIHILIHDSFHGIWPSHVPSTCTYVYIYIYMYIYIYI